MATATSSKPRKTTRPRVSKSTQADTTIILSAVDALRAASADPFDPRRPRAARRVWNATSDAQRAAIVCWLDEVGMASYEDQGERFARFVEDASEGVRLDRKPASPVAPVAVTPEPPATVEAKPAPAPVACCGLRLTIAGVPYRVRPVAVQAEDVVRAFTLKRVGSEAHTIAETLVGPTCSCGDFVWRHDGNGTFCRHIKAARAVGLL